MFIKKLDNFVPKYGNKESCFLILISNPGSELSERVHEKIIVENYLYLIAINKGKLNDLYSSLSCRAQFFRKYQFDVIWPFKDKDLKFHVHVYGSNRLQSQKLQIRRG